MFIVLWSLKMASTYVWCEIHLTSMSSWQDFLSFILWRRHWDSERSSLLLSATQLLNSKTRIQIKVLHFQVLSFFPQIWNGKPWKPCLAHRVRTFSALTTGPVNLGPGPAPVVTVVQPAPVHWNPKHNKE